MPLMKKKAGLHIRANEEALDDSHDAMVRLPHPPLITLKLECIINTQKISGKRSQLITCDVNVLLNDVISFIFSSYNKWYVSVDKPSH